MKRCIRVVLTGGPGGGKTTAADLFRREIGDQIVVVPEAATLLFSGGFPRLKTPDGIRHGQKAIFHVQRSLEEMHFHQYSERMLLCDRGTPDGAAYWPGEIKDFFLAQGTTLEQELARYDAVVFFETAAAGNMSIEGGNIHRQENLEESRALDHRLQSIWQNHKHFVFIPHQNSFLGKIRMGLEALVDVIEHIRRENGKH